MSFNRKLLSQMIAESKQKKTQPKPKDRIVDPMGQWAHPGQVTRIPSNRITMQGVPYPVLGRGSDGSERMMYPEEEHTFPDAEYVDEYPLTKAQNGIQMLDLPDVHLNLPKYSRQEDKKVGVNPYMFGFNPQRGVNIHGIGAQGYVNLFNSKKNKLGLTGNVNSVSVGYPGGVELFGKPQFFPELRFTHRFENGGPIVVPYSKEYTDKEYQDYNKFYEDFNKPPYLRKDDGFDKYYHKKIKNLPGMPIYSSGWERKNIADGYVQHYDRQPKPKVGFVDRKMDNELIGYDPNDKYPSQTAGPYKMIKAFANYKPSNSSNILGLKNGGFATTVQTTTPLGSTEPIVDVDPIRYENREGIGEVGILPNIVIAPHLDDQGKRFYEKILDRPSKPVERYEPSNAVKYNKGALSAAALSTMAAPEIQYLIQLAGATGDFYTGTRYALDKNWSKAGEDYTQGLLGLIPYSKALKGMKGDEYYTLLQKLYNATIGGLKFGSDVKTMDEGVDKKQYGGESYLQKAQNGGDISIPNLEEGNWLDRYDEGGLTTDETTFPILTREEHEALYNSQIALNNFYENEVRQGRLKRTSTKTFNQPSISNREYNKLKEGNLSFYKHPPGAFYDALYKKIYNLSPSQIRDLERKSLEQIQKSNSNNQLYYRDIVTPAQNLVSPFALVDKRVKPQRVIRYEPVSGNLSGYPGGNVEVFDYDPLYIKPPHLRSKKENLEWEKLYGDKPENKVIPPSVSSLPPQLKMVRNTIGIEPLSVGTPSINRQPSIQPNQSGDYVLRFSELNSEGQNQPREVFFKTRKEADDMMDFLQKENQRRYETGTYYGNLTTQGNYKRGGQFKQFQPGGFVTTDTTTLPKETRYVHNPSVGGKTDYAIRRTVTPYKTEDEIRKFTEMPTSGEDVDFLYWYRNASNKKDAMSVPFKGDKHWNIDRGIIDVEFGKNYPNLNQSGTTVEQNRNNVLADMYKYYMLQYPDNKDKAWREAKRFVRKEIDPRINNEYFRDVIINKTAPNTGTLTGFGNENPFKRLQDFNQMFVDNPELAFAYHRNYNPSEWTMDRMKGIAKDYLRDYKGLSRRDTRRQLRDWENELKGSVTVKVGPSKPLGKSVDDVVLTDDIIRASRESEDLNYGPNFEQLYKTPRANQRILSKADRMVEWRGLDNLPHRRLLRGNEADDFMKYLSENKLYTGTSISNTGILNEEDRKEFKAGGQLQQFAPGGFLTTDETTKYPPLQSDVDILNKARKELLDWYTARVNHSDPRISNEAKQVLENFSKLPSDVSKGIEYKGVHYLIPQGLLGQYMPYDETIEIANPYLSIEEQLKKPGFGYINKNPELRDRYIKAHQLSRTEEPIKHEGKHRDLHKTVEPILDQYSDQIYSGFAGPEVYAQHLYERIGKPDLSKEAAGKWAQANFDRDAGYAYDWMTGTGFPNFRVNKKGNVKNMKNSELYRALMELRTEYGIDPAANTTSEDFKNIYEKAKKSYEEAIQNKDSEKRLRYEHFLDLFNIHGNDFEKLNNLNNLLVGVEGSSLPIANKGFNVKNTGQTNWLENYN